MQTIKKILVDIDPDKQEQPALSKALHFAKHQPITIMLLSCLYYPAVVASNLLTPKQLQKTQAEIIKMNQGRLNQLISQHSQENVTYETQVMWHSPIYQGILKVVDSFKPDLVIKATHQHKVIARRLFTPTDWYLLKACPVPILLVKNQKWTKNTSVVAAIDPEHNLSKQSELDKNILKAGFSMSSSLGIPLHALHCFDPSYWEILLEAVDKSGMWADVFSVNEHQNESMVLEQLRYQHNVKFAEECSEYVPNSENQHIMSGDINHVLPKTLTQLDAGILVLGTTYRTGLLGSTAQRLIEAVDCDLLAVKPKGFEVPFH
ncbi:MAG: universal stress protein E [Arenicella sp.]|jgi:universal stress protein E